MRHCSVILLLFFILNLSGNTFNFKELKIERGLDLVHDICRDKNGYVWITNGVGGILRHNSYYSKAYTHDSSDSLSLSNNEVLCLHVDPFNNVWVGTSNGLNLFDRKTNSFKRYLTNVGPDPNEVNRIFEIYTGIDSLLWVVRENSIARYDYNTHSFHIYRFRSDYNNLQMRGVVQDNEGTIWISTNNNYILKFNPLRKLYHKIYDDFYKSNTLIQKKIHIDFSGDIWLTTKGEGLIQFNPRTKVFKHYPYNGNGLGTNNRFIYDLLPLDDNTILIAVDQGGINIFNKTSKKFTYLTQKNSTLPSNGMFSFWLDFEDILWVGTSRNGVLYHHPLALPIENLQFKEGQNRSANIIGCLYSDHKNNIWIGTDGDGIRVVDSNLQKLKHLTTENTPWLRSNVIRSINQDKYNNYVVVSWDNLVSTSSQDKLKAKKLNSKLIELFPTGAMWGIFRDSKDRFWFIFPDGNLALFDPDFNYIKKFSSLGINFFRNSPKVIESSDGAIFFSNSDGLHRFDESTGLSTRILSTNRISTFDVSDKYIVIGGIDFGIQVYSRKGNLIKKINTSNGLSNNIIKAMKFDKHQNLWVSTLHGLNYINFGDDEIKQYFVDDGLIEDSFFSHALLQLKNGKLVFGTYNGIVAIVPDSIKANPNPLKINIDNIAIYNSKYKNRIRNVFPGKEPIVLSWAERMFIIDYSAINFNNPHKSEYKYKLEGYNTHWIHTGPHKRTATYTNLNPGIYTFTVKAANSDGIWNNDGASVQIRIKPPFWKTKLWYALLILITLSSFYFIIKVREYRLKREKSVLELRVSQRTAIINSQKEKLEKQTEELEKHRIDLEGLVDDRTKELVEAKIHAEEADRLKMRFLANMSHEIRTPINAIRGYIHVLLHQSPEQNKKQAYYNIVEKNSEQLIQLVDNIIDIAKIESNQIKVVSSLLNISLLTKDIYTQFKSKIAENTKNPLVLNYIDKLPKEYRDLEIDGQKLRQILTNLLGNAVVFCDCGTVEFGLYADNVNIILYVKDEGPGIHPKYHEKIFNSFYTLEETELKAKPGVGLGLSIAKKLSELLSAELTIESAVGRGTTFTLKLPIDKYVVNKLDDFY